MIEGVRYKMKKLYNSHKLVLLLSTLSAVSYLLVFGFFAHRSTEIVFLSLNSLAFAFVQVLIFTFIIEKMISEHEKKAMLEKMNMVIGVFFQEAGTDLLKILASCDSEMPALREEMKVGGRWTDRDFVRAAEAVRNRKHTIKADGPTRTELKAFMEQKRDFLLRLLENPSLLEHETFTELLLAVFHIVDEFHHRQNVSSLPENDVLHIEGDLKRAYALLIEQWLAYAKYLKDNYPYLFSLAARMNPFDAEASATINE
jgi:hypothetical protein